jgi:3-deoxy-D-manno-octulosonic-acid transferase
LIIAGSTMNGEEEVLLEAFHELSSAADVKMLIAPRHPERFEEVCSTAVEKGFKVVRRSANNTDDERIMILDTIGELAAAYEFADLVFIGGTLSYGGHNPIEPAYYRKAIVSGPRYENFRAIFEEFIDHDAVMVTSDLRSALVTLSKDQDRREKIGKTAQELVKKNQGAADFVLQNIRKYLDDRNVMEPGTKSSIR